MNQATADRAVTNQARNAGKAFNPFYVLLVVTGVLFVVTASAYGMMTLRNIEPSDRAAVEGHGLMQFMEEHGTTALLWELGILALATVAAIGTENWWHARRRRLREPANGEGASEHGASERRGKSGDRQERKT